MSLDTPARTFALLLFGALLSVTGGCAYDAQGLCERNCEAAVTRGCREPGGCSSMCANANSAYDTLLEAANRSKCFDEFDRLIECAESADVCDNPRCQAQNEAFAFCAEG